MGIKIEEKAREWLKPYPNNPRKNDKAVDAVAASIREFGFKVPIIADKDGVIIAGHTRLKAAEKLGLETVPVIVASDLTEEQAKALRLADNKTAELAEWDPDLLLKELSEMGGGIDMQAFGFEPLPENINDVQEDDYIEPEELEPRTQPGDVWSLGDHVLMCGDSADAEAQRRLFNGHAPKLIFTDPPYGVAIGSRNKAVNKVDPGRGGRVETDIEGDTLDSEQLYKILVQAFSNLKENADPGASYYVSSPQGGELGLMMLQMMKDAGLPVRHQLVWVKSSPVFSLGRLDYDYRHEPIFYTWTKRHEFLGGYSNTVIDDTKPLEKMTKTELKDLVHALQEGRESSVIYCDKPTRSELHPTMKPVKLIARFVINSSREGDTVADIFGGSGTTMIACEQLKRKCRMMELDPHYCDVIIDRWEKFTNKKAEKL